MATGGVKYQPNIPEIIKVIHEKRGICNQIHVALGIGHTKFYELLDEYPELKAAVDKARAHYNVDLCEDAQHGLHYTIKQRDDLGALVRACQYVLNNKGRFLGYTPLTATTAVVEQDEKICILDKLDRLHASESTEPSSSHSDSQDQQASSQVNHDKSE